MKNMILLLSLLLCLCVSSWASCTTSYINGSCYKDGTYGNFPVNSCFSGTISVSACGGTCSHTYPGSSSCSKYYIYASPYNFTCIDSPYNNRRFTFSILQTVCDTQAEADSVVIAQKCTSGTMAKDTVNGTSFDVCKNGEGLLITFNNPITGVRDSSIGYYIVTDSSADLLDEATYNHLATLACTEVSLYRGVLNGKYVYWYSTDPEPAGVVNVVRIK